MSSESQYFFRPFHLDPVNMQLWKGAQKISLRPKTFEVLRYLLEHSGQLVTKRALLDAVWADVIVGDVLPANSVQELRRALSDNAKSPRFIETVHRRGYRFIAPVTTKTALEPRREPSNRSDALEPTIVGRETELARLRHWYSESLRGRRRVIFLTGEPGIGKTTLVNAFLDSVEGNDRARIGRGQCVEQYGVGEPYMPVLDALSRLTRESGGARVREVLSRFAPTWLAQMPELLTREERSRSPGEIQGLTQHRMLREMTQALDALAAEESLVLVLEDLHWSDFSTLELISAVARRSEAARMMIIGTYRPAEIHTDEHPLHAIKQELEIHRNCEELQLMLLGQSEIGQFLKQRLSDASSLSLDTLASIIHTRTEGNPLFMVNIIDYLDGRGLLIRSPKVSEVDWAERLRLHPLNTLRNIPQMIERNLERLRPDDQAVLEVASVAGTEFSAAVVAAALVRPQTEIEAACLRLSRRTQFVAEQAPVTWPDGAAATGFRFHHALYQEVLYDRLSVGQRAEFHRLIAARLEAAYRGCAAEVATELANHYRRANMQLEAIQYFQLAGQRAISRAAVTEARGHFAEAIRLLHQLPESVARDRRELALHLAVAPILVAVLGGWYASETEKAWSRALELCNRVGDSPTLFPAVFGMYALQLVRGKTYDANRLAKQLLSQADSAGDAAQMLYARIALGVTFYYLGEFTSALENLEICLSIYDSERHAPLILHYGFDAGVWGFCFLAATYWQLGYPDKALHKSEEAFALARKHSHPLSLAQAELWAAALRQMRREPQLVGETSDRLCTLSAEHGLTDWLYWADCLKGWAIAMQGHHEEGIEKIWENEKALEVRGLRAWRPYLQCFLAEACLAANRIDDGIRALEEALAAADEGQERAHEPQIYRLRGELLQKLPDPDLHGAQMSFEQAIKIAQTQGARSLELCATSSLARLLAKQGHRGEARSMLAEIYNWFTEGFDTADLKEAKALLDVLN